MSGLLVGEFATAGKGLVDKPLSAMANTLFNELESGYYDTRISNFVN